MSEYPPGIPFPFACDCVRCRDKRVPLRISLAWLRATESLTLDPDLPFGTLRFKCGRTIVITWGHVQALRLRMAS